MVQKLVAGLIGVPLDEVRKRGEITWRRETTIRTLAGLSATILAVVAAYFLWYSSQMSQREVARDQQQQHQLADATKQLVETKAIVEKLLSISQAQAAPGRDQAVTDAVTATVAGAAQGDARLQRALEFLKAGKIASAEPLLRAVAADKEHTVSTAGKEAAEAYRNLGAIAGLADQKRAREAYGRAVALDPSDREALYWYGWLQLMAGDLSSADSDFNRLLAASLDAHDERGTYRAYLRLGLVLLRRGNLQAAHEQENQAYSVAKRGVDLNPTDGEWQRDLAVAYHYVGEVQNAQEDLAAALTSYQASLAMMDLLAISDANNPTRQRDLGVAYYFVGDIQRQQGDQPAALTSYQSSLATFDRLAKSEPDNALWQSDLSVAYDRLGTVQMDQGNLLAALTSYQRSLTILDRLAKSDPDNALWQYDLAIVYRNVGVVQKAQGNLPAALTSYQTSLATIDRLAKSDPDNALWQYDLARVCENLADAYLKTKEPSKARENFAAARAVIAGLVKKFPDRAQWKLDLIRLDQKIAVLKK